MIVLNQMGDRIKALYDDARASEIAEVAVVMPLLIMLVLGIMWFGRAFNIYTTVHHAAHEAARSAVASGCATCPTTYPTQPELLTNVVNPILSAAHLDPSFAALTLTPTSPPCPSPLVPLNSTNPVECGTALVLTYPFGFRLNGLTCCPVALTPIAMGVTIRAQAQARQED